MDSWEERMAAKAAERRRNEPFERERAATAAINAIVYSKERAVEAAKGLCSLCYEPRQDLPFDRWLVFRTCEQSCDCEHHATEVWYA